MQRPRMPVEYGQLRVSLEITHGKSSGSSAPVKMPYVNDATESIVSMSRRLTTLIVRSSKNGGFRGVQQSV